MTLIRNLVLWFFCWRDHPILSPSLSFLHGGCICAYCKRDHRIIDAVAVDSLPQLESTNETPDHSVRR